jgi:transcription antitermination protein NusB
MESEGTPHKITPHRNTRREARELILRMLFQVDVGKQPLDEVVEGALAQSILEGSYREFAEEVARGTWEHRSEIDNVLHELSPEWTVERQPAVDRNILRLTAYEILYRPETPVAAAINEAVELAKKYSTAESGRFVNGVLGALARTIPRGLDEAASSGDETEADSAPIDLCQ